MQQEMQLKQAEHTEAMEAKEAEHAARMTEEERGRELMLSQKNWLDF